MAKKQSKAKLVKNDKEEEAPETEANDEVAGPGHNIVKGEYNEALVEMFEEHEALNENKKELSKAQRELRSKAKEQFGVSSAVFNHLIKLRKMDTSVRVDFENSVEDTKVMLGYQASLDLEDPNEDHGDDPEEAANRLAD
jgi:uncharacterized protein (UPF0335 family)